MTARKPLVLVDGHPKQLPDGDSLDIPVLAASRLMDIYSGLCGQKIHEIELDRGLAFYANAPALFPTLLTTTLPAPRDDVFVSLNNGSALEASGTAAGATSVLPYLQLTTGSTALGAARMGYNVPRVADDGMFGYGGTVSEMRADVQFVLPVLSASAQRFRAAVTLDVGQLSVSAFHQDNVNAGRLSVDLTVGGSVTTHDTGLTLTAATFYTLNLHLHLKGDSPRASLTISNGNTGEVTGVDIALPADAQGVNLPTPRFTVGIGKQVGTTARLMQVAKSRGYMLLA